MKIFYLTLAMMAFALSAPGQASEQDARAYCEDAARLMQLDGDKAAAYIKECIAAKLEEEAEE